MLAVRCDGVTKEFGAGDTRVFALRGVDVEVELGTLTMIVGPSGCGKTTLISVAAGLLDPTDGDVEVLGEDVASMSGPAKTRFRQRNIGFVFQQYNLLPALTAAENAAVPLLINRAPRSRAVAAAREWLGAVGLADRADALPSQMSGGQQQRVAIARSLVHEPRLLVCDEPTAALDAKSGQTVMELLKDRACRPDRAVVVVTHDNRIFHFADRIVHMEDGRVERVEDGAAAAAH